MPDIYLFMPDIYAGYLCRILRRIFIIIRLTTSAPHALSQPHPTLPTTHLVTTSPRIHHTREPALLALSSMREAPYCEKHHTRAARPEHVKELGRWCWVREEKEREGDRHAVMLKR